MKENKSVIMNGVHKGLWLKVHASRRRKDPRKAVKLLLSMVRSRCKTCQMIYLRGVVVKVIL
jgi:hypothetical protein